MVLASLTGFLGGCASYPLTLREEKVNHDLYKNIDDFLSRVARLRKGMTKEEAFSIMGVTEKTRNVSSLDGADIRNREFPDMRLPNVEEATRFNEELQRFTGYSIPYAYKIEKGILSKPFHYLITEKGYDVLAVLIFRDGLLHSNQRPGMPEIDKSRKLILFTLATHVNAVRSAR
jgi:hypothetical protein